MGREHSNSDTRKISKYTDVAFEINVWKLQEAKSVSAVV